MKDDLEHPFFLEGARGQGAPAPEDWIDPDFDDLDDPPRAQPSMGVAAVLLAVGAFALWTATQYVAELRYFFTPSTPIELGLADDLHAASEWWQDGQLVLPSNRHVRIEGGVDRPSTSRDKIYFKLIGATVYVEMVDPEHRTHLLRNEERSTMQARNQYLDLHEGTGRLVAFEDLPDRYAPVVEFYANATRTWFCGHRPSQTLTAWRNNQRGRVELALLDELGRAPTDAEIDQRLGPDAGCQRGYLLIDGESPRGMWWILLTYLLLLGIVAGSGVFLVRWYRSLVASRQLDDPRSAAPPRAR